MQNIQIQSGDGFQLAATVFMPDRPSGQVILLNSATGVKRRYYVDFAKYLASEGFVVYTYDYRGIGGSRPVSLRKFEAHMHQWGELDFEAMLVYIKNAHPQWPIAVLGHSAGGQILGMAPSIGDVAAVVTVAAQSGYWRHWGDKKWRFWFLWSVLIPTASKLLGYFPARKLGQGEDLPKGVAMEWAKWCRHPEYLFGYLQKHLPRYHQLNFPLLAFSSHDDDYAPKAAVEALLKHYPKARIIHRHIYPGESYIQQIGHFGFFRKRFATTLWPMTSDWIKEQLNSVKFKVES